MKSRTVVTLRVAALFAVLAVALRLAAQERRHEPKHHHYRLIEIGTLGGLSCNFNNFYDGPFFDSGKVLSRHGTFVGWADTPTPDPFQPSVSTSTVDAFLEPSSNGHSCGRPDKYATSARSVETALALS